MRGETYFFKKINICPPGGEPATYGVTVAVLGSIFIFLLPYPTLGILYLTRNKRVKWSNVQLRKPTGLRFRACFLVVSSFVLLSGLDIGAFRSDSCQPYSTSTAIIIVAKSQQTRSQNFPFWRRKGKEKKNSVIICCCTPFERWRLCGRFFHGRCYFGGARACG